MLITTKDKKMEVHYNYLKNLTLNDVHSNIEVNLLECIGIKNGKKQRFCWITKLELNEKVVEIIAKEEGMKKSNDLMEAGRFTIKGHIKIKVKVAPYNPIHREFKYGVK